MLTEEVIEKVTERLVRRMEKGNEYVLEQIGKSIKKIGTLSPSKAQELAQIMKYGGDYDKIVKKLAEITELNVRDIKKIFEAVAKSDYQFAEQFYKYRGKKYIPYDKNSALKKQVDALASITKEKYINLTKTYAFARHNKQGKVIYTNLSKTYQDVLDEAVLNVGQGKESFDSAMRRTLRELAQSGIRTVDYEKKKSVRADTAVRMNLKEGLRTLHNEMQQEFGKEFDSDGVEVSVHANPAPDHEEVQGRIFSTVKPNDNGLSEWEKLQETGRATDYKGREIDIHRQLKDGTITKDYRPISTLNCYHYVFAVVLGVSEPTYSDEQLQEIIDKNHKGFEYEDTHYTMYEGTQLQRKLESAIRNQKDKQILARSQNDKVSIAESQEKIRILTNKYNELSKASGLPTKIQRMQVEGYRTVAIKK